MKGAIIVCLLALAAVTLARPEEGKYTNRYDNINLDEILANKKLLEGYTKCILDKGKCTPEGKELKSHIKEAMETDCAKCTTAQRDGTNKVLRHLINHEPATWTEMKNKYDPTGKYSKKHEDELKSLKA